MPRLAYPLAALIALAVAYLLWKPLLDRKSITPAITPAVAWRKAAFAIQLNRTVPEINFTGQEFADVFDFLRDISGSNIFVDWGAIEAAGVRKDTPIRVRIKGASFFQSINLILSHAGKPSTPLVFRIDDVRGGIEITTQAQLDHGVNVRTHDLTLLMGQQRDPLKLAFGYSPFHYTPPDSNERFADIQQRIRARFGQQSVLDSGVYLTQRGAYLDAWNVIVPQTKAKHGEIDEDLAYFAWIP